jgi:hypothetical protein
MASQTRYIATLQRQLFKITLLPEFLRNYYIWQLFHIVKGHRFTHEAITTCIQFYVGWYQVQVIKSISGTI